MFCMHIATEYIQLGTFYNRCTVVLKIYILFCGISLQEDGWTDGLRDMLTQYLQFY